MHAFHSMVRTISWATLLVFTAAFQTAAFTAEEFGFEPQNKATATINVIVSILPGGETEYSYEVTNREISERSINLFYLQIDVQVTSVTASTPRDWSPLACCARDKFRKDASGVVAAGWQYDVDGAQIAPGNTLSGFKIRGRSIPAIKRFFVQSQSSDSTPDGEPGSLEEEAAIKELTDFFNDSTFGITIGPEPPPAVIDPSSLIDRLVSLKHQSISLGWLTGDQFIRKLDRRLDKAKKTLSRNKPFVARIKLKQFIRDLEHQRRKQQKRERDDDDDDRHDDKPGHDKDRHMPKAFINDNAFFLLKVNAEFIISKLPEKPKDKDEDREGQEAEHEEDEDDDD